MGKNYLRFSRVIGLEGKIRHLKCELCSAFLRLMTRNKYEGIDPKIEKAVCHYARKLKRSAVFKDECLEDLEQELMAYVFEKLPAYDSQKSALSTFVSRILEIRSKKMLRNRVALKQGFRYFCKHIDPMDEKTHPIYEENLPNSINPITFCQRFPKPLRQTCELLKEHSVSEIAEILHVSPATVYHRILKMRSLLKEKMNENNEFK